MTQEAATAREPKGEMYSGGFSSYSVNDVSKAKDFYSDTLGLDVSETKEGLSIKIPGAGDKLFLYAKGDHESATFTVFNLLVDDVEAAVDELTERGIKFLQYDGAIKTDDKGIFWGGKENKGPNIAWFEDPSGNILSVIESHKEASS